MTQFLFVDDRESEVAIELYKEAGLDADVLSPQALSDRKQEQLKDVLVFLVDLTLEDWDQVKLGRPTDPSNGIDLASILRSRLEPMDGNAAERSAAICLYSRDLDKFGDFPAGTYRQHAIARLYDLEWVFEKNDKPAYVDSQINQLKELKEAVLFVRGTTGKKYPSKRDLLYDLFGKSDLPDFVWEDIESSRPPIFESLTCSAGLSVVRWLLHRILPYPTFLIDDAQFALRLRLPLNALQEQIQGSQPLKELYDGARYGGVLKEFLGPRLWRHDVERRLWEATNGLSSDPKTLKDALSYSPTEAPGELVVCINENYAWILDRLTPMNDAVRVVPEDWPVFAEPAWMAKDLIREHNDLRELVIEADRASLE